MLAITVGFYLAVIVSVYSCNSLLIVEARKGMSGRVLEMRCPSHCNTYGADGFKITLFPSLHQNGLQRMSETT